MATRPYTDITNAKALTSTTIKHGIAVVSCTKTGQYSTLDTYAHNTPIISDIDDKYGNRFYNGVFVASVDNPVV